MSYVSEDIPLILKHYEPSNPRTWPYFPIVMPLVGGNGPATDKECDEITFEVWDHFCNSFGSFKFLPDALEEALKLNKELEQEYGT